MTARKKEAATTEPEAKEPEVIEVVETKPEEVPVADEPEYNQVTIDDPWKLMSVNEDGIKTEVMRVGNAGVAISRGMSMCFAPGASIVAGPNGTVTIAG
jgi:hypothetical protein